MECCTAAAAPARTQSQDPAICSRICCFTPCTAAHAAPLLSDVLSHTSHYCTPPHRRAHVAPLHATCCPSGCTTAHHAPLHTVHHLPLLLLTLSIPPHAAHCTLQGLQLCTLSPHSLSQQKAVFTPTAPIWPSAINLRALNCRALCDNSSC